MTGRTGYTEVTNGDGYDPAVDMTAIYEHFDPLVGETVADEASLPASDNWQGRTIMVEDTKIVYVNTDGTTGWKKAFTTVPIAFTPTIAGVTTSNNEAVYTLSGGRCFVTGSITVSAAPSTLVTATTPFTVDVSDPDLTDFPLGICKFIDTGSTSYPGLVDMLSSGPTLVRFLAFNASATYLTTTASGGSVPHGWVSGDKIDYKYDFIPA